MNTIMSISIILVSLAVVIALLCAAYFAFMMLLKEDDLLDRVVGGIGTLLFVGCTSIVVISTLKVLEV